jgi:hypothetical protein
MKIPVYQKTFLDFLGLIVCLLLLLTVFIPSTSAQDEPALIIELFDSNDWNQSAGTIVYEGKNYDVTVSTENESIILGVNISVLGTTYLTSITDPFITIKTPLFDESDSFVITATKEGYRTATVDITVLKGELFITTSSNVIEEKKQFQITVRNQDNTPVDSALVYVTEDTTPILTDSQGIVTASAPEVDILTPVTIQAIKSGYLPGTMTIRVENVQGSIFDITESKFLQILPILFAILVVIFAVLYVLLRQKRPQKTLPPTAPGSSSDTQIPSRQGKSKKRFKTEPPREPVPDTKTVSGSSLEPRVEEIRIPTQSKKKETTYISEEKEPDPVSEENTQHHEEWFKGQDYMRYKLDELTGKIDQKTDGKWFEGEYDVKYKVDEALKKNLKKKKTEKDDSK